MARFAARLATLALALWGAPGFAAAPGSTAEVKVEALGVFDVPDAHAIASGQLERGQRVVVQGEAPGGWLAIEPPAGSFHWVEATALRTVAGSSKAEVTAARAVVRSGIAGARMPGAPRGTLPRGAVVELVDRPPLVLGQAAWARSWRAIAPASGEVRYILAAGVEPEPLEAQAPEPAAETRATFLAAAPTAPLPRAIAAEVARIETAHRAEVRQPVGTWRLDQVRQDYKALLARTTDADAKRAIQARLEQVEQHESASNSVRKVEALLARCRTRERNLTLYQRRLQQAEQPHERPYDAEGMIQPSSRKVDGQRVFALIGSEGTTLAYLNLPAGLDPSPLLARQVGVRGTIRYDEHLRARLISVSDLDPIDELR